MKLWLNEYQFKELSPAAPALEEIATRQRYAGLDAFIGALPDPDPVLRKLGQDMAVYRELLSDAHVWSCYSSRKSGTSGRRWEIEEAAEGGTPAANRRALAIVQEAVKSIPMRQVINAMLDAPFFGMAPIEVIWEQAVLWLPARIEGKPAEWFGFDQYNGLRFMSWADAIEGEPIPAGKILLCRHHASYLNPYGERLLSKCFWPVTFKRGGFKFWAIFMEKFGMPWITGKVPPKTGAPERELLKSRLAQMVLDAVAVINNDESVEITEAAGKQASGDLYRSKIEVCNREISKAILSQTLSTELDKGGSFAASQSHLQVREELIEDDAEMVADAFNTLFAWITALNVPEAAAPVFTWVKEEDVQKERADRDAVLSDQGVAFTPTYYQRTYNLEPDDFTIATQKEAPVQPTAQFAEPTAFTPNQQSLENLADAAAAQAAGALAANEGAILDAITRAGSYEAAIGNLLEAYPELDMSAVEDLLQRTLTNAELFGRYTAKE